MGDVMNQPDSNENLTMALQRMHRWRMAFFGLILMISGSVLGAAVAVLVLRPADRPGWPRDSGRMAAQMALRLKEELGLSTEQEKQIRTILEAQMEKLEEMRKAAFSEIQAVMQTTQEQMGKVLSQEQRQQLEEELERMRRQFPHGRRPGPPGDFRDRRGRMGDRDDGPGPGGPRPGDRRGPRGRRGQRRDFDPNGPPPMPPMEGGPPVEPNELPNA